MFNIIKQVLKSQTIKKSGVSPSLQGDTQPATPQKLGKKAKGIAARNSGYNAEDAAAAWLTAQGLRVVERNVRYTFGEIDIVAWHGAVLVLFEVRLRNNRRFGSAAASITPTKQARLWAAAEAYAAKLSPTPPMRIDVLAYDGMNSEPQWIHNALG